MGIRIAFPRWEDEGTLPPEGQRNFIPGTYAKAKWMDALMHTNYLDHATFKTALEKYGTAVRFLFDDLKTLVETDTGEPPIPAVVGIWPAWLFPGVPPGPGKTHELYAYLRLGAERGVVRLQWTVPPAGTGKKYVWGLGVQAVPVGGDFTVEPTVQTYTAVAAAQPYVRNETSFEFGPLPAEDLYVALRIFRDAASVNDDKYPAYLVGVEVTIL